MHQKPDVDFNVYVLFTAKSASGCCPDDPDFILGNAENRRDLAAVPKGILTGIPNNQVAMFIYFANTGFCFQVNMIHHVSFVSIFNNNVREFKSLFNVTLANFGVQKHVAL